MNRAHDGWMTPQLLSEYFAALRDNASICIGVVVAIVVTILFMRDP